MKHHLTPADYHGTLLFDVSNDEATLTVHFQVAALGVFILAALSRRPFGSNFK